MRAGDLRAGSRWQAAAVSRWVDGQALNSDERARV